ncbi:MAG: hypothetical protein OXT67_03670 [Zetaproteobacteria bacterium]|nr:hypothetical protein [Zetaproteobacteria bacterium]
MRESIPYWVQMLATASQSSGRQGFAPPTESQRSREICFQYNQCGEHLQHHTQSLQSLLTGSQKISCNLEQWSVYGFYTHAVLQTGSTRVVLTFAPEEVTFRCTTLQGYQPITVEQQHFIPTWETNSYSLIYQPRERKTPGLTTEALVQYTLIKTIEVEQTIEHSVLSFGKEEHQPYGNQIQK